MGVSPKIASSFRRTSRFAEMAIIVARHNKHPYKTEKQKIIREYSSKGGRNFTRLHGKNRFSNVPFSVALVGWSNVEGGKQCACDIEREKNFDTRTTSWSITAASRLHCQRCKLTYITRKQQKGLLLAFREKQNVKTGCSSRLSRLGRLNSKQLRF